MKNKLLMLIIYGIFTILLLNIVFSYFCYQEKTNESYYLDGVCGLNYSGTSYDPNTGFDWWYGNKNNVIDGNWSSYASTSAGGGATIISNYAKPTYTINSTNNIWQIKDGTNTTNLTISNNCMTQNSSFVILKVILRNVDIFGDPVYYWGLWSCMNETGIYETLLDRTAYNRIYEEAIIWELTGNMNLTFSYLNLTLNRNTTQIFNYTANYNYSNANLTNRWWFVNNTNVLNDTDFINSTYLIYNTNVTFILELQNLDGELYNFSVSEMIPYIQDYNILNLVNQSYNINALNMSGNGTNFTTYNYLNVELSVNFTSNNTNLTNNEVWYQWFLDGVNVLKGFGRNVLNLFFEQEDLGSHLVQVNASTTENGTNDIWSENINWNITIVLPKLEPDYIFTDSEIYDSVDIICNHKYTGHVWLYDIDVLVTLQNGTREWIKATQSLTTSNIVHFITREYLDDRNVTIRCRTFNTYFNYSNYTYSQPIWKKSVNDVRLFRIFNKPIFVGQLNAFETECDMSKNNKYEILYHWMDGNADGTYDKLMSYEEDSNQNKSTFLFETKYIISGQQSINTGCIIKKLTSDSWDFSYCNEEEETCAVQKTFRIEVFE